MAVPEKRKPIAILSETVPRGINWALDNLNNVQAYSSHTRQIVANGRIYIIFTRPEQLLGIEIEDYQVSQPWSVKCGTLPDELVRMARTRKR